MRAIKLRLFIVPPDQGQIYIVLGTILNIDEDRLSVIIVYFECAIVMKANIQNMVSNYTCTSNHSWEPAVCDEDFKTAADDL